MLGGAGGALAAVWGTRMRVALAPLDLPRRESIVVDWGIAVVVIVIGVGALLRVIAAAPPALCAARTGLRPHRSDGFASSVVSVFLRHSLLYVRQRPLAHC